jgi:hypothetical protein
MCILGGVRLPRINFSEIVAGQHPGARLDPHDRTSSEKKLAAPSGFVKESCKGQYYTQDQVSCPTVQPVAIALHLSCHTGPTMLDSFQTRQNNNKNEHVVINHKNQHDFS